jgi:FAD dependent oxidoreductase
MFRRSIAALFLLASISVAQEGSPNLRYWYPLTAKHTPETVEADVCIYGGTPGGVGAAIGAARAGKKAVLVVFRKHVGGMTSGGLTATDVGRAEALGGITTEFYKGVGQLRGFRPSKAEEVFLAMLKDAKVPVYFEHRLKSITKDGNRITSLTTEDGDVFKAKIFVDTTYEGDLLAMAGVSFHVGREGNAKYGETINGVQFHKGHSFTVATDPYKIEGDPKSGLLWGISPDEPGTVGQADKKVQAYNFRMFISDAKNRLPFQKPAHYDRDRYQLLLRYIRLNPKLPIQLHNGDCNNEGAVSSDMIGMNYAWPEGDYATREKIFQDHVNYQQGFMWFLQNDPEVPPKIQAVVKARGLNHDEFPETGGWPHELYVREGRRMISDLVMTQAECASRKVVDDSVGMASYNMDSHNCQRVVVKGHVQNEGDVEIGCPNPYPVSYRSIVPKEAECVNLFVPVCLSSSHIAYGSIRMEPVFMILGQSAGTAAAMAIDGGISVQKVEYAKLKEKLLAINQVLEYKGPKREAPSARIDPKSVEGIVVDDTDAKLTGEWSNAATIGPFVGDGYLHDNNEGHGTKSVKYVPELPKAGMYDVYLTWSANKNRATNVPVEIGHADGVLKVTVNQQEKGGWHKLGTLRFEAGKAGYLVIRNDGANGYVIADAARWVAAK